LTNFRNFHEQIDENEVSSYTKSNEGKRHRFVSTSSGGKPYTAQPRRSVPAEGGFLPGSLAGEKGIFSSRI
jgi:hypothetical protein